MFIAISWWRGGGGSGSSPRKVFCFNGVKSCNIRQNKHGNALSRTRVYNDVGRRIDPLNVEVIGIFQTFMKLNV